MFRLPVLVTAVICAASLVIGRSKFIANSERADFDVADRHIELPIEVVESAPSNSPLTPPTTLPTNISRETLIGPFFAPLLTDVITLT